MPEIKLYVCCHKPFAVPENPLLRPIQVGTALAEKRFDGFLHDDEGIHISDKNRSYCELTALYWAWKNEQADYYGLFHYRRYLYPDKAARRPYRLAGTPTESLLRQLGYDGFAQLIGQYDLIVPVGEDMHVSVREHYASAPFHHGKDLELIEEILREKDPEDWAAAEEYLNGTVHYFGNIAIMSRRVFHDYCGWLFSVLEEFDRRGSMDGYSPQELRVDGYLAERLLGVYYTRHKAELRTLELPRVHFESNGKTRMIKQLELALLPAGSGRRAYVKQKLRDRT